MVATAGQVPGASANDAMHRHAAFRQVNLISDVKGMAKLRDPAVKNPWGITFGTKAGEETPLWVNNQFSNKITLYTGANGQDRIAKVPLTIDASSPTGIVFNDTKAFKIMQGGVMTPARFIFTENFPSATVKNAPAGQVTGWSNVPAPPTTTTPGSMLKDPAEYDGLALVPATHRHGPWLLAADFRGGMVDIYNRKFEKRDHPNLFVDHKAMKQGLLPYNVMRLDDGRVYVAYGNFGVAGSITVFNANGMLLKRLVVRDKRLLGPWGMAIAPRHWGHRGGSLLVGNVENGLIVAYNRHTGMNRGVLRDAQHMPIMIPGLWGIMFGNGVIGTPRRLIFAAGIGKDGAFEGFYEHGLVGYIAPKKMMDDN